MKMVRCEMMQAGVQQFRCVRPSLLGFQCCTSLRMCGGGATRNWSGTFSRQAIDTKSWFFRLPCRSASLVAKDIFGNELPLEAFVGLVVLSNTANC